MHTPDPRMRICFLALSTTTAQAQTTISPDLCANPYALNAAQRESCGDHSYPLIGTHPYTYGATAYEYDMPGGTATVVIPPESFDALTSSEQERAAFGIPPEPSQDSLEYARWRESLEHLQFPAPPPELMRARVSTECPRFTLTRSGLAIASHPKTKL